MPSTSTDAPRADLVRIFIAIALAVATGAIALATFDYAVVAMQADLHFSAEDGNAAMLVPAASSLAVVFVAGVLGDRLGRRRVMVASGVVFVVGALIVAVAPTLAIVVAGQVLEGVGGAALAITALAVLSATFTTGRARAVAFGAFSALVPAVFIVGPVLGSALEQAMNWRAIPLLSVAIGITSVLGSLALLRPDGAGGGGEVMTPLLAGLALCGLAGTASALLVAPGPAAIVLALIAAGSIGGLIIAMRATAAPSLRLAVLRAPGGRSALIALALANAANLLFFTTLLLQYLLRMTPFETALAMIPVQVAATAGGFAGGWMIARLGVFRAGVATLSATALASLAVLLITRGSPAWVIVALASVYAFAGLSSTAPLTQRVMDLVPDDEGGVASAFRSGAAAVGAAVGGVLVAALAFGAFQGAFATGLERAGFTATRADEIAAEVRQSASLTGLHPRQLGIPRRSVRTVERENAPALERAEITAYRAVGICTAVANALAALVLLLAAPLRRWRDREAIA